MDNTTRTQALTIAKALISSHGLSNHMNKYNREAISREIRDDTTGLRYDFHLDPFADSWSSTNPSCSLSVVYELDPKGSRIADDGSVVVDSTLRVGVTLSGSEMSVETLRRREGMVTLLGMLCELLTASLPSKVTSLLETREQAIERRKLASEQLIGDQIMKNIGHAALKGLRRGGTPRRVRLTEAYTSKTGDYPEAGTYRYRYVRSVDNRGRPREMVHYLMKVHVAANGEPPGVTIQRLNVPSC